MSRQRIHWRRDRQWATRSFASDERRLWHELRNKQQPHSPVELLFAATAWTSVHRRSWPESSHFFHLLTSTSSDESVVTGKRQRMLSSRNRSRWPFTRTTLLMLLPVSLIFVYFILNSFFFYHSHWPECEAASGRNPDESAVRIRRNHWAGHRFSDSVSSDFQGKHVKNETRPPDRRSGSSTSATSCTEFDKTDHQTVLCHDRNFIPSTESHRLQQIPFIRRTHRLESSDRCSSSGRTVCRSGLWCNTTNGTILRKRSRTGESDQSLANRIRNGIPEWNQLLEELAAPVNHKLLR